MSNWTGLMNQPEPEPTRQGRINAAALRVAEQTGKGYEATADMLNAKADSPQVLAALAKGAGLEDVTVDEAREAVACLRRYAADPRYNR